MTVVRIIIAGVVLWFLISGLRRGLVRQVLDVVGIVVAFVAAYYLAHPLAASIAGRMDLSYGIALTAAALLIFAGLIAAFHMLGRALRKFFNLTVLGAFDSVAGGVLGALKGLLLVSLVLVVVLTLPLPLNVRETIRDDPITGSIYPLLPVMYDLVAPRIPGGDRFEAIVRGGGAQGIRERTEKLRRSIEDGGGELKDRLEGFKDKVAGPQDENEESKEDR